MKKVLILGGSGMLGSMVQAYLNKNKELAIYVTERSDGPNIIKLNAESPNLSVLDDSFDYIINCIGLIKHHINDVSSADVLRAIRINSVFPHLLAERYLGKKTKIIQIATDCVYSGSKGGYLESDKHDALDVYGKSKSLGEVIQNNFYNIRCSIIGPEQKNHKSLLDWFLSQETDATINGYSNHFWNGITTLHFSKLVETIMINNIALKNITHFIPIDIVSKYELLKIISLKYKTNHKIKKINTHPGVNRSLGTTDKSTVEFLWKKMGYKQPQTIEEMIQELSLYEI